MRLLISGSWLEDSSFSDDLSFFCVVYLSNSKGGPGL
ncbi:hypothetical protein TcasGA2_TC034920 [Tribolium castaneum]|uniref:Uncharacterized protein n=1 Tax=Tribolium castaneum TaxID=7070 RepID=A0A139WAH1_TRICA|nr:hypothetical protein TcasGA2_TC034920 [Tribolium castaneum]